MDNNKVFYDQEGNECSLYKLVRSEPGWAESRILAGLKDLEELRECSVVMADLNIENKLLKEWVRECRDAILYPLANDNSELGRIANGLGQASVALFK